MLKFMLASGNAHKAQELSDLFLLSEISITAAPEKLDVEEDGDSFLENAVIKARSYHQRFKSPVIADDSGLIVDALPGELGLYSARFGGEGMPYADRCSLLLEKMKDIREKDRSAYFICLLVAYFSDNEYYFFEGKLEGKIAFNMSGNGGFGFDPVFIPNASPAKGVKSLAELCEWKQSHSHRALAAQKMMNFFKNRHCQ